MIRMLPRINHTFLRCSFPQRLAKAKLEQKYGKFIEILKSLHINIPFLDAISEIPSYGIFLKDLISSKKKLEESTTLTLSKECSAILLNKLPPKLDDPGSFSIPCCIGNVPITSDLCDLGASLPIGVCEDVPLVVGKLIIPCDFFVMDIPEDSHVPIILGRPCLATAGAMIDVKNGKPTLQVGDDKDCLLNANADDMDTLAYAWMIDSSSPHDDEPPLETLQVVLE
ncbi:hypothetical protein RND81_09G018500 [Saponaria officinalis]|uniref:Uncharacterized protein n=1 Tax=Saponaria officinalis TaxID=3572 RepID=A0AAW1IFZ0_SAPOF